MLRKEKRRKSKHKLPVVDVNVVSLMDVLTVLLFFLIMISSAFKFSILPASSVPSADKNVQDEKPSFALQVTLTHSNRASVYLGPTDKLIVRNRRGLYTFLQKQKFKGGEKIGFLKQIKTRRHSDLLREIEKNLIAIKRSFPGETKAVVAFTDRIQYQELVNTVSRVRELGAKTKPIRAKDLLGRSELTRILFPEVLVTEWIETKGQS